MLQTFKGILLTTLLSMMLAGCVYKIDVQQGNIVTQQDIQKIHRGMSIAAVERMLGSPLLKNIYKTNHLYYVYTMKRGRNPMSEKKLIIYFRNGQVTSFNVRNYVPHK